MKSFLVQGYEVFLKFDSIFGLLCLDLCLKCFVIQLTSTKLHNIKDCSAEGMYKVVSSLYNWINKIISNEIICMS